VEPALPAAPQAGWEWLLSSWLVAHRTYPEFARRRGDTGDVTLRLAIAADARVTEVTIVASTTSREVSDAAMTIFRGAVLPPPQLSVVRNIRLRYRLED
jgi:protein TonB